MVKKIKFQEPSNAIYKSQNTDANKFTLPASVWALISAFNKRWHKLLDGEHITPYPRISSTGTGYFGSTAEIKDNYNYEGPIITEKNLSKNVLDELRKQVRYAQSLGYNSWTDYGGTKADGTIIPNMQRELYGKEKPSDWQLFKRWVSPNTVDMVETTFGHYNFHTDESGNTIIEDTYDFTPEKGGWDKILAPLLGDVKDGNKNLRWKINLGKIDNL